jgi:hypothetical protein
MPGELGGRKLYDYTSSNGVVYAVMMRDALAAEGGFTASTSKQGNYPRRWRMRHVMGRTADKSVSKVLHVSTEANAKYVSGGTFTIGPNTFVIYGSFGEKRPG